MEERRIIAERIKKKAEHKQSDGYANWLAGKTHEREFKTTIGEKDLMDDWSLKPAEFPHLAPGTGNGTNNQETPASASSDTLKQGTKRGSEHLGKTGSSPDPKIHQPSTPSAPASGRQDENPPNPLEEKDVTDNSP